MPAPRESNSQQPLHAWHNGALAGDLALLALLLAAYYAYPLLMPGLDYRGGDPVLMSYPYRLLLRESLQQGVLPLWNPYAGCGTPSLAAYQGAFLYPPHWLVLLIPSIGFVCRLVAFLHYLLQAAGAYALARFGFELGRGAALFAGLALGVSAFNAAHVEQFIVLSSASWIPAILWAWLMFLRRPGPRPLLITALCLALAILSGHAQYWLYALDIMALLAVVQPVEAQRPGLREAIRRRMVALAGLGLCGAMAFLLAAAQLLPAMELAGRSERVIDPPNYGEASSFPPSYFLHYLLPGRLPQWNEPYNLYFNPVEMTCFIGRVTLALALLGLLLGARRRASVRALAVWVAVAALLALGRYGPLDGAVFRFAEKILPGWKGLRVPARLLFVANLGIILLAAHGLNSIGSFLRARMRSRIRASGPQAVERPEKSGTGTLFRSTDSFFLIVALCCAVVLAEQSPVSWRLPLRYATPKTAIPPSASLQAYFSARAEQCRVFGLIDPVNIYRADSLAGAARLATLEPNTALYAGVGTVRCYVEGLLPLLRTEDFLRAYWRNFYTPRPDAELLGLMNVAYLAADKPVEGPGWELTAWIPPCEEGRNWIAVYRNLRARPPVFWAAQVENAYDLKALDGAYVSTGQPSPNASQERPLPRLSPSSAPAPQPDLSIRRLSPNRVQIGKPSSAAGDMLFATSAYPGWTAQWKGGSQPLTAENAVHLRFHAPAGAERIDLVFQPFSFRLGLFLSLLAWAALAVAPWLTIAARKRNMGGGKEGEKPLKRLG